ncbi:uncharacterized protein LOC108705462 [Xenopus laevis]|uniref:Uncharacterized protein LOC108705462 n=2 Tax=Xenopus laevis TaxID=8355 RepID=A0A310U7R6_XENLA|nr:uncharacterized protein LOC108705462 [Xenopus laevis]OCT56399.1 hypothetical protein XELAEV_18000152mg [Xenopus laevis]
MDVDQLREYIRSFSLNECPLGNQGYNRILLQVFGFLGHGKSSLINSCKYALLDTEFKKHAEAAANDGGLTMERKTYPLTGTIIMVDNRGCAMINAFEMAEIYAQLCNFVPLEQRVEWNKNYEDMMFRVEDDDVDPNFTDFIVPIFVYSVRKEITAAEIEEIKPFLKNCRDLTGIFPIIVLTNKTSGDIAKLRNIFEGMGAEEILAVENYTDEDHFKTRGRHTLFLELIHKALKDVNFCMKDQRNPKKERAQRKKFLLKYVHERDKNQPPSQ